MISPEKEMKMDEQVKAPDCEATNAMKALRGPLSNRATSSEFNEWMARDVVEYIDHLRAELDRVRAAARAEALEEAAQVAGSPLTGAFVDKWTAGQCSAALSTMTTIARAIRALAR